MKFMWTITMATALILSACVGDRTKQEDRQDTLTTVEQDTQTGTDTKTGADSTVGTDTGAGGDSTGDMSDTTPPGDVCSNPPTQLSELDLSPGGENPFIEAICILQERCGGELPLAVGAAELTLEECKRGLNRAFSLSESTLRSLELGTAVFDFNQFAACVGQLCTGSCDLVRQENGLCGDELVRGTVQFGDPCYNNDECAGAARCDNEDVGICPGKCVSRDPCGVFPFCPASTYCDYQGPEPSCKQLVGEGEECQDSRSCGEELYCNYDEAPALYLCVRRQSAGGPCRAPEDCQVGLRCVPSDPADPELGGDCRGLAVEGEPCERDRSSDCDTGLFCYEPSDGSSGPACQRPIFLLTDGSDCRSGLDTCTWPSACLNGVCADPKSAGEPCSDTLECAGYCDGQSCHDYKGGGAACNDERECLGFCSVDKTCADAPLVTGSRCQDGEECQSRVCLKDQGANFGQCIGSCIR